MVLISTGHYTYHLVDIDNPYDEQVTILSTGRYW